MQRLVAEGKLGAKTGGDGLYTPQGEPDVEGDAEPDVDELVELLTLKTFVEACLVLEEGVATHRDIDVGMMAGAGLDPRRGLFPPFMKADIEGLDVVLERLESATERHGERFAPPLVLRRLVAQGRLGQKSGQGFYPYAQADDEQPGRDGQARDARRRRHRVAGQRPDELDRPAGHRRPARRVGEGRGVRRARAGHRLRRTRCCSARAPTSRPSPRWTRPAGASCWTTAHGLLRSFERSSVATIAAVNGLAFGGGCELAMACDVRIAAQSALFGQPEVKLGIIPGFGGTQRLPRLVGENKALEMNLVGDAIGAEEAYVFGLVNRVVLDHELLDTALAWARKLAGQAPLAVGAIKEVSAPARPRRRHRGREGRLRRASSPARTPARASAPSSASASRRGAGGRQPRRDAWPASCARPARSSRSTGAGISVPSGIPDFRSPGTGLWENVDPMAVAHIDAWRARPRALLALLRQPLPDASRARSPTARTAALAELERRGAPRRGRHPEHRHAAPQGGHARARRGPRDHRVLVVPGLPARGYPLAEVRERLADDPLSVPRCDCGEPLKPDVVLFGEWLPEDALERAYALAASADVLLCVGTSLEVHPIAQLPGVTRADGGAVAVVTQGPTPWDDRAAVKLDGDVVAELEALVAALGDD